MRRDLSDVRSVTLNASGGGSVSFGPNRPTVRWLITGVSVVASTNAAEATGVLFRGSARVSETFSASSGASDNALPDQPLNPGETYRFVWTGGDPGALATISFRGVELIGE